MTYTRSIKKQGPEWLMMGVIGLVTLTAGAAPQELGFTWKTDKDHLIVAAVTPSSAAAEGVFEKDDVIVSVEGTTITTAKQFDTKTFSYAGGSKLKVPVERGGKPQTLWLVVPRNGTLPVVRGHEADRMREVVIGKGDTAKTLFETQDGTPFTGVVIPMVHVVGTLAGEFVGGAPGMSTTEYEYHDGQRTIHRTRDPNGQVTMEYLYDQGRYSGHRSYDTDGQPSTLLITPGKPDEWLNPNGTPKTFISINPDKAFEGFHAEYVEVNGRRRKVFESEYRAGDHLRDISYDLEGRMVAELQYRENHPFEGRLVKWHWLAVGQKLYEEAWRNGVRMQRGQWHANGTPSMTSTLQDGHFVKDTFFDPQGAVLGQLMYREEKPFEGTSISFHGNGRTLEERTYQAGHLVHDRLWGDNGNQLSEDEYQDDQPIRSITYRDGKPHHEWTPTSFRLLTKAPAAPTGRQERHP